MEEHNGIEISNKEAIDSTMQLFIDGEHYPFIYTRLEDKSGSVLYEKIKHPIIGRPKVDGNTWIRIWSMSKIVTICIALDLMEDGLLNLEDPLKYIPEFKNLQVALTSDSSSLLSENWYEQDTLRQPPCPPYLHPK